MAQNPVVILTQGIPASGKSFWANEVANKFGYGEVKTVSMDDLRAMLDRNTGDGSQFSRDAERFAGSIQLEIVNQAVIDGHSVIVHNTHLHPRIPTLIRDYVGDAADYFIVPFLIDIETAKARNAARDRSVPEEVIDNMYRYFLAQKNDVWEGWTFLTQQGAAKVLRQAVDDHL